MSSSEVKHGIIFREAEEEDCDTILKLMKDLVDPNIPPEESTVKVTAEDLRRDGFGESKAFYCILAEDLNADGRKKIVGFALYCYMYITFTGRTVWLEDLYVCEEYRRRGIGRNLMRHVAKVAMEKNCKSMYWFALGSNANGQRFYRRCGGENLTTDEDYHGFRLNFQKLKDLASEDINTNIKQCAE